MFFPPIKQKIHSHIYYKMDKNPIRKDVLKIAWPVLLELLLSSLFGMIDMMMLGRIKDPMEAAASVAAIGLTNQPLFIGLSLVQALNIGATAMVGRYLGTHEYEKMETTVKHVLLLNVLFVGIPWSIITIRFAKSIMIFMGAEWDALQYGLPYFKIIMVGFIFQSISFALSAALRGVGETKAPMKVNITVNLFNVIGNAILIYGLFGLPALGVKGAALSTAGSHVLSAFALVFYVMKGKSVIPFHFKKPFRFDRNILLNFIKIGVPASLEQLVLRVGLIIFAKIVASLGTVIFAAHQIGLNILGLSFQPGSAFGISASALLSRSLGEEEPEKAEAYAKETRRIGSLISTIMAIVFFLFSKQLVGLYTNDPEIIKNASTVLKIIAFVQPFQSSQLILAGGLRGAGDTVWPLVATLLSLLCIRTSLAYLFVKVLHYGLLGAWIAIFVDQFVRWIIIYLRFLSGKWKDIKIH
ncbi:MAG: MATE family efflux transporter [Epulopiscium sp.]|nr:MATE family efflux transporter [Candidatus Epulonipiscium sp.]